MEDFIVQEVAVYGSFAVFLLLMLSGIGISIGEEIIIIPAGVLVGDGQLAFWPTLLAAWLGVICSDCLWFTICHRYGVRLLHKRAFKRLVHPRRLLEAKHQLEKRGAWMVVMARFIPGSRTTAITVAGIFHMPFWKFALVTAGCTLITAPAQLAVGILSVEIADVRSTAGVIRVMLGVMMFLVATFLVLGIWRRRRMSRGRPPRARARWLRRFRVPRPRLPKGLPGRSKRPPAEPAHHGPEIDGGS